MSNEYVKYMRTLSVFNMAIPCHTTESASRWYKIAFRISGLYFWNVFS